MVSNQFGDLESGWVLFDALVLLVYSFGAVSGNIDVVNCSHYLVQIFGLSLVLNGLVSRQTANVWLTGILLLLM